MDDPQQSHTAADAAPVHPLQTALAAEQAKTARMRQLGTTQGFYLAFFMALGKYDTNVLCFEAINNEYFDIWGEFKYRSYDSFRTTRDYYNRFKNLHKKI